MEMAEISRHFGARRAPSWQSSRGKHLQILKCNIRRKGMTFGELQESPAAPRPCFSQINHGKCGFGRCRISSACRGHKHRCEIDKS